LSMKRQDSLCGRRNTERLLNKPIWKFICSLIIALNAESGFAMNVFFHWGTAEMSAMNVPGSDSLN